MQNLRNVLMIGALALAPLVSGQARAADVFKVGVIAPLSGPFAEFGKQFKGGIESYQKVRGTTAAGKTVQVIYKDSAGPNPDAAKRLAQELVIRDKVQALAGFVFTPNALAVAPVATEAKVPMIVMNAASGGLTEKSPYMARLSFSLPSTVPPMARWAAKRGIKKVFIIVADYGPGHDVEAEALKDFEAQGIKVVGDVRTPVTTFDFSPYMQRVEDTKPDALFAFVNGGDVMAAFLRDYRSKGLPQAGVALIGTGDITSEEGMNAVGKAALGTVTTYPYSMDHPSETNKAFVEAFQAQRTKDARPSIMAVAAYDGMAAIYKALDVTGGDTDGEAMIHAMEGMKIDSPRGPIEINPKTRDVDQAMYIREVMQDNKSGLYVNREFGSYPAK